MADLDSLRECGVTDDYSSIVPRRTLTHRRARREALSRDRSDRVVQIARVVAWRTLGAAEIPVQSAAKHGVDT